MNFLFIFLTRQELWGFNSWAPLSEGQIKNQRQFTAPTGGVGAGGANSSAGASGVGCSTGGARDADHAAAYSITAPNSMVEEEEEEQEEEEEDSTPLHFC